MAAPVGHRVIELMCLLIAPVQGGDLRVQGTAAKA